VGGCVCVCVCAEKRIPSSWSRANWKFRLMWVGVWVCGVGVGGCMCVCVLKRGFRATGVARTRNSGGNS